MWNLEFDVYAEAMRITNKWKNLLSRILILRILHQLSSVHCQTCYLLEFRLGGQHMFIGNRAKNSLIICCVQNEI